MYPFLYLAGNTCLRPDLEARRISAIPRLTIWHSSVRRRPVTSMWTAVYAYASPSKVNYDVSDIFVYYWHALGIIGKGADTLRPATLPIVLVVRIGTSHAPL